MATEIKTSRFTVEQKEAWQKAKQLLAIPWGRIGYLTGERRRALHIAMSELRAENGRKHKGPIETLPKNLGKLIQYHVIRKSNHITERVQEWKDYFQNPGIKKLYILVREDLSTSQEAVQASHCAAQFQKEHPHAPWVNGTMVLLVPNKEHPFYGSLTASWNRVKQEPAFEQFIRDYCWRADYLTTWRELDLNNEITAVALLMDWGCPPWGNESLGKYSLVKLL